MISVLLNVCVHAVFGEMYFTVYYLRALQTLEKLIHKEKPQ